MEKNGYYLGAGLFVAGAVMGAAVAMFTTPYSGRRMRRKMQYQFEDGAERFKHVAGQFKNQWERLLHQGEHLAAQAQKMVHSRAG